jgi:CHAD domain-containing protein
VERFLKEVRRTRRAAGRVRDVDVAERLLAQISEGAMIDDPAAASSALKRDRRRAARALRRLAGARGTELTDRLGMMLATPAGMRVQFPAAMAYAKTLGASASVLEAARGKGAWSPEELHKIRLSLKAARAVLGCAGGSVRLVERMERLSDQLGRVNDLVTLAGMLREMGEERSEAGRAVRRAHVSAHRAAVASTRRGCVRLADELHRAARRALPT